MNFLVRNLAVIGLVGLVIGLIACAPIQEVERLEDEVQAKDARIAELTQERDRLQARVDELETLQETLEAQVETLEEERERLRAERDDLRWEVDEQDQQIADLREELAGIRAERDELSQRVQRQEERIAELEETEQQLARMQEELDRMQAELEEIEDVEVIREEDVLTVRIGAHILFDTLEADLRPDALQTLQDIGDVVAGFQERDIRFEGHADNRPITYSPEFRNNRDLAAARALSVLEWFEENTEIPAERMASVSYGEYRPLVPNINPDNMQLNRRVEIVLYPPELPEEIQR